MRVISFNANGIRSAFRKGFFDWFNKQNADFLCVQETKAQFGLLPKDPYFGNNYFVDYFDATKKGYSGVALYALKPPKKIIKEVGFEWCDNEGRYIQFDYEKFSIVSLYMPSGTSGDPRQAIKYQCLDFFKSHFANLKNEARELIICGDYNIAHKEIDLKNWRSNQKNSGFLLEERQWMDELFTTLGFVDAFRVHNQEPHQYTWWSNRGQARANNVGWRIDYQVITPNLRSKIIHTDIYQNELFSDHAPLIIDYEGDWTC